VGPGPAVAAVKALVTGGLGFVGHAVCRQLVRAGHEVIALTSRPDARSLVEDVETVHADIRDTDALRAVVDKTGPAGVCHLAALTQVRESFARPIEYFDVNVGGTIALLQALASVPGIPVVMLSTGAVYGQCEGQVTEDEPVRPPNPYASSKVAAEQLLAYQAATSAVGAVTLRCFNIAGAVDGVGDQDPTRIMPNALATAAGLREALDVNGDGSAVREFTHVADVASAVALAMAAATPGTVETYNVGSGIRASMLDVVHAVERVTGRPVPVVHRPAKPEPTVMVADSSRLRADLGWQPEHTTLDGIVADGWDSVLRHAEASR
jgi:UDP-glucose 4-epimerase